MHTPTPRRWIDVLIVVGGIGIAVSGFPAVGAPLAALGFVFPVLQWAGRRRSGDRVPLDLVPTELADAHRAVVEASRLAGVDGGERQRDEADTFVVEVAALLGGRPPRGGAQLRFVAARTAVADELAASMRERHDAWLAACEELGADGDAIADSDEPDGAALPSGPLVAVLLVVLGPVFLVWDVVQAVARGCVGFVDGIALRVRTTLRAVANAVTSLGHLLADVVRRWTEIRRRVVASAREARARFVAARVRTRMRLRLAVRDARGR